MKGNEIDDLFRQKLSHQKLAPPPGAWEAVEQNLPKKKNKVIYYWLSAAASIALIFTIGWHMSQTNDTTTADSPLANQTTPTKTDQVAEKTPAPAKAETVQPQQDVIIPAETVVPQQETLVAANTQEEMPAQFAPVEGSIELTTPDLPEIAAQEIFNIEPIDLHKTVELKSLAGAFDYSMLMPMELVTPSVIDAEGMDMGRKKKKFRVLNGIISIAKGVNSGKLGISGLRNAKNNFVNDELKYGSKSEQEEEQSSEEDIDAPTRL